MSKVWGQVNSDGGGVLNATAYSSTRISKGKYQVDFNDSPFASEPSVVVTLLGGSGGTGKTAGISSADATQFSLSIQTNNGNLDDASFNFVAVGD